MLATSTATTSVFAHALPYAGGVYVIVLAGFLSVALYQRAATKKTPETPSRAERRRRRRLEKRRRR